MLWLPAPLEWSRACPSPSREIYLQGNEEPVLEGTSVLAVSPTNSPGSPLGTATTSKASWPVSPGQIGPWSWELAVSIPWEPCTADGWWGAGCAGCCDINPVPLLAVSVWHPGVWVTLGSGGWLRTLGFGADQVVQPWQAAPQAAAHKSGCLGLVEGWKCARFALGFIFLVMHRGSCGTPGALAVSVPFGSTKGQIAASSKALQCPRGCPVSSPALLHPLCW